MYLSGEKLSTTPKMLKNFINSLPCVSAATLETKTVRSSTESFVATGASSLACCGTVAVSDIGLQQDKTLKKFFLSLFHLNEIFARAVLVDCALPEVLGRQRRPSATQSTPRNTSPVSLQGMRSFGRQKEFSEEGLNKHEFLSLSSF